MGCDIHCWLEHREADDAPWQIQRRSPCECQTRPGECWRCDDRPLAWVGGTLGKEKGWQVMRPAIADYDGEGKLWADGNCYHSRNYALFAVLAGVRCDDEELPVFEPRGIPDDASPEFKAMAGWVGDGEDEKVTDWHSHSYLDLTEVEASFTCAFDMTQQERAAEYASATKLFWRHVVELQMRPIAARVGPHNVRIVFFFDN